MVLLGAPLSSLVVVLLGARSLSQEHEAHQLIQDLQELDRLKAWIGAKHSQVPIEDALP